ncbi:hypothetical protein [Trueperella sp. LYQ143]
MLWVHDAVVNQKPPVNLTTFTHSGDTGGDGQYITPPIFTGS